MRTDFTGQAPVYGGYLTFQGFSGHSLATPWPVVSLPLWIRTMDVPIRQLKNTEVNTIPTNDFVQWSDGTVNSIFFGSSDPLEASIEGILITPTITVTDSFSKIKYQQVAPTTTGLSTGQDLNLHGYTNGDLISLYLEGKLTRTGPSILKRTDPVYYVDPFGNVYVTPVISEFTCSRVPGNVGKESFTMKLWLET